MTLSFKGAGPVLATGNSRIGRVNNSAGSSIATAIKQSDPNTASKSDPLALATVRPGHSAAQANVNDGETANEGNTKNQVDTKKEAEDKKKEAANTANSAVKSFDKATKPSEQKDSSLKAGDISKEVNDAIKQNQNSGNNSGNNSDQDQNRFVSKDPINSKDPSQVDSQSGGKFADASQGLSDGSRFEQVAGKQFSSDPETAGKNFGLDGPSKDASQSQQQQPVPPIQGGGFGGAGGIGNAFGPGSAVNNGIINNGQLAMNGGEINNGGGGALSQSQPITNPITNPIEDSSTTMKESATVAFSSNELNPDSL